MSGDYGRVLLLPFEERYWGRRRQKLGLPMWGGSFSGMEATVESDTGEGAWSAKVQATATPTQEAFRRLGLDASTATEDDVRRVFKERAFANHPDRGGSVEAFRDFVEAKDRCLSYLKAASSPPR